MFSRSKHDDEIESGEFLSPARLAAVVDLRFSEPKEIAVIRINRGFVA